MATGRGGEGMGGEGRGGEGRGGEGRGGEETMKRMIKTEVENFMAPDFTVATVAVY